MPAPMGSSRAVRKGRAQNFRIPPILLTGPLVDTPSRPQLGHPTSQTDGHFAPKYSYPGSCGCRILTTEMANLDANFEDAGGAKWGNS